MKQLKSQEETKHIPVIMFSAHPSAEETARNAGADDFLAKPFEIDELVVMVARYPWTFQSKNSRLRPFCALTALSWHRLENPLGFGILLLTLSMARLEFPSTAIGAKHEETTADQNGASPEYSKLTLDGLASEPGETLELGNCLITSAVTFRKRVKGNEWRCTIQVEPDLMHPDQEGEYEAIAYNEQADKAQSFRLRPGDRAVMRGMLRQETTILAGGKEVITNSFSVTDIEPLSRSRRTSVTVYEQDNGGDKKR